MNYTISKKADEKVQQDLNVIKGIIIKRLNPISIILFGGFGRGEGSFELMKGRVIPLNDYDMYAVTKSRVEDKLLDKIGKECSKAIGRGGKEFAENYSEIYDKNKFFHVDLRCLVYSKLGRMRRINRTYELKYGSTVIYGEDIRKKIKISSLPLSEAFRYLINPACHLLLCMDSRRLKGRFRKDEDAFAMHHICKTYLAIASSLLISAGKFEPTYRRTSSAFTRVYSGKFPELAKRIEEAARFKVMPRHEKIKAKDILKKWFQSRDDLICAYSYISRKHLGIEAESPKELVEKLFRKLPYSYFTPYLPFGFLSGLMFPAQYFLNMLYFKRTGKISALFSWRDTGLRIAMAAILLLYSIEEKQLLENAYRQIRTFSNPKSRSWEDLRVALLYAFDKYFSQKLI